MERVQIDFGHVGRHLASHAAHFIEPKVSWNSSVNYFHRKAEKIEPPVTFRSVNSSPQIVNTRETLKMHSALQYIYYFIYVRSSVPLANYKNLM